ncbi:peptide/nickel transport system ATP-binding protein [Sporobacter termitidis DSM 10068]|uniref:Peptide/nickel transport system ATP-binding protein n=1 Tax=Sporobacter termitidis DSM 10068 TaxID=1123282 RepID=A0A1M5XCH3_9FIRM|nr:oligopeptide/dipeptide ABC transporter ATP-binding protein [Sporobacter termitidis]SHH96893.1 peptide/nickel transport system ATP-binding protein [Sporobacter termitidis DSM 10068]
MSAVEPLLELRDLSRYYRVKSKKNPFLKQQIKAVDRLSLSIYPGETFGLVGESGCGKSTAGHVLAGILPPTAGEIRYGGKSFSAMSGREKAAARREIQIVLQDPSASLNPKRKIGWIVGEPLLINADYSKQARQRLVAEMLETVGLDESCASRYPHELSGGQRQRVNIAAALMLASKLLVADEVVSALDVSVQSQILNLLKKLQRTRQLTYLFISHDLNVVQYMSDRLGVMYLGRLVEYGAVDDIYGDARHPYTKALLSTMPSVADRGVERIILEGEVPSLLAPPSGCAFHTRCRQARDLCRQTPPEMREICRGHYACCHFALENKG